MTGAEDPLTAPITAADIAWEPRAAPLDDDWSIDLAPAVALDCPKDAARAILIDGERQLRARIWQLTSERDAYQLIAKQGVHYAYELTVRIRKLCAQVRWLREQNRALRGQRPGA